jgi:hypothetical protein
LKRAPELISSAFFDLYQSSKIVVNDCFMSK